ncbi:MAG: hypothetical protein WC028_30205 [Candidatus Obscuribacterales bacterium]
MKANCIDILEELGQTLKENGDFNTDIATIIASNFLSPETSENCVDLAIDGIHEIAQKIADHNKNDLA